MHGGKRQNSGRKSKAEEARLIERLDNIIDSDEVIKKLKELIDKGDRRALQLYLNYRYGKPTETKNISIDSMPPIFGEFEEE